MLYPNKNRVFRIFQIKILFTLFGRDFSNGKSLHATIRSLASAEFKYSPAKLYTRFYKKKSKENRINIQLNLLL